MINPSPPPAIVATHRTADWAAIDAQVRRVAAKSLRHHDAEEVIQETLLRLWRTRNSLELAKDKRAWIATFAHNEVRRHLARPHHREELTDTLEPNATTMPTPSTDERLDLVEAIRPLSRHDREVLVLFYVGDWSLERIAGHSGSPIGTVKARLHRARARLSAHIGTGPR